VVGVSGYEFSFWAGHRSKPSVSSIFTVIVRSPQNPISFCGIPKTNPLLERLRLCRRVPCPPPPRHRV
jgi:hypothetical protein